MREKVKVKNKHDFFLSSPLFSSLAREVTIDNVSFTLLFFEREGEREG